MAWTGTTVASNKMALKIVVDDGKRNKAMRWVGDARWGERWEGVECCGGNSGIEFAKLDFDSEMGEFANVISKEVVVMYITRLQEGGEKEQ